MTRPVLEVKPLSEDLRMAIQRITETTPLVHVVSPPGPGSAEDSQGLNYHVAHGEMLPDEAHTIAEELAAMFGLEVIPGRKARVTVNVLEPGGSYEPHIDFSNTHSILVYPTASGGPIRFRTTAGNVDVWPVPGMAVAGNTSEIYHEVLASLEPRRSFIVACVESGIAAPEPGTLLEQHIFG